MLVIHLLKTKKGLNESFMPTGNAYHIYKTDLDKACFQHNIAYGKYKDFNERTESGKLLKIKVLK